MARRTAGISPPPASGEELRRCGTRPLVAVCSSSFPAKAVEVGGLDDLDLYKKKEGKVGNAV